MTVLTTNFQLQTAACTSLTCAAEASSEKKQLSPDVIRILLGVSPQLTQIHGIVDDRCYALHEDKKIAFFSTLFKEVIEANKSLFSFQPLSEKVHALFKFHSDEIIFQIINSEKLNPIVRSFFQELQPTYQTPEVQDVVVAETVRNLRERILYLHADYVRVAIAKALEVSIRELPPSSREYAPQAQELKKPSGMDLYTQ